MLLQKEKKSANKGNRLLISISVLGSAGPIRFLVNEDDLVLNVIQSAVKKYAREGRLPVLGSDLQSFLLYSADAGASLSPLETIGSRGGRNFVLCKKPTQPPVVASGKTSKAGGFMRSGGTGNSGLKSWISKSLSFKISSH